MISRRKFLTGSAMAGLLAHRAHFPLLQNQQTPRHGTTGLASYPAYQQAE